MQNPDPGHVAAGLLARCRYINIASMGADGPWNTPVTAVADAALNLYWSSWIEAQHSRHIHDDARVFITLYDSTRERGTNRFGCLYLRARARQVTSREEGEKAHGLIYPGKPMDPDGFFDGAPKRFYVATPEAAWLNDLSEREVTPRTLKMRVEVPLADICAACQTMVTG